MNYLNETVDSHLFLSKERQTLERERSPFFHVRLNDHNSSHTLTSNERKDSIVNYKTSSP